MMISRRKILELALLSPLAATLRANYFGRLSFLNAPGYVVPLIDGADVSRVKIDRRWKGSVCHAQLINQGDTPVRIKEVVLFDLQLSLPASTRLYGEGFQMLSQTAGTLGQPTDLGNYTDAKHYKLPAPLNAKALYGMMMLSPFPHDHHLLAFTSCRRFIGQFYLSHPSLKVVLDTEGSELAPGESWLLEPFTYQSGSDREQLLDNLATQLIANHPPLRPPSPPTGWCSWYCFGPRVTAQQVLDNLDFIAKHTPGLRYVQIDDGYQPATGDWLETGAAFGGNVQGVLKQIKGRGFEPAIWVAPFIAEEKSNVFRNHPDWFVKGDDGKPLRSDKVTFGGWRSIKEKGAWYALDGTNPEAQKHLENVFRTMRNDWGVSYFKLDANFWGAMHGGRFFDNKATRIEAYRRGMQAILRGAGDGFILGCNHPMWASLGLIHGSRSSNDIKRSWERISTTAKQNLSRNWQNSRLWWNDPDAVVLVGDLSPEEFQFHATAIFASGGMILSGDDLTKISPERLTMLKKLLPPARKAASFADDSLRVGTTNLGSSTAVSVFNWDESPQSISFDVPRSVEVTDFWIGRSLGRFTRTFEVKNMPPRSARLFVYR